MRLNVILGAFGFPALPLVRPHAFVKTWLVVPLYRNMAWTTRKTFLNLPIQITTDHKLP